MERGKVPEISQAEKYRQETEEYISRFSPETQELVRSFFKGVVVTMNWNFAQIGSEHESLIDFYVRRFGEIIGKNVFSPSAGTITTITERDRKRKGKR